MKKIFWLLALIGFVGCSNDIEENEFAQFANEITMSVKDFKWDNKQSKTTVDISQNGVSFNWAENDTVGIFPNEGAQAYFPMISGTGSNKASFTGGGWALKPSSTYAAYYPYNFYNRTANSVEFNYSGQIQNGNASTAHLGKYDFMAAVAKTPQNGLVNFEFDHLGVLVELKLVLPKAGTYSSVIISDSEAIFTLKGKVNLMSSEPGVIANGSKAQQFVVGLNNITTTKGNEEVKVYFLAAPVNLQGKKLAVSVKGSQNCTGTMTIAKGWSAGFAYSYTLPLTTAGGSETSGYYSATKGASGSKLKTAMFKVIASHKDIGYDGIWNAFLETDSRSDGKVWDMYSSKTNYTFGKDKAGNYKKEGDVYNREHSFPKSWFKDARPMHNDLFHLYPTDGYVNGRRGNYPFGETNGERYQSNGGWSKLGNCTTPGYTSVVFEPNDEYKGDFARSYFYMATAYEDRFSKFNSPMLANNSYPCYKKWALDMLLRWAKEDPVSEKEIKRNNAVHKIQGNRNPYIDFPGLEQYIWGDKMSVTFDPDNYYSTTAE